jgi:hypothetical protein
MEPSPMYPSSSSRAFQRHQEHYMKHPSSVDLITTKQNKLRSFIDRYVIFGALLKALMPIMDVPSSYHDFMVELCSMKVQIFMQKFGPSSSMELHPLENPIQELYFMDECPWNFMDDFYTKRKVNKLYTLRMK